MAFWNPNRLVALCLVACAACALPQGDPRVSPEPQRPSPEAQILTQDLRGGVPVEFVPVLDAIRVALEEGANETARHALRTLFARNLEGRVLDLALAYERILDGRERVDWIDLRLEAVEDPEVPALFRLDLVVSQHGSEDLVYRPGGARLWVYQSAVGANGSGQRGARQDAVPFPEEIVIQRDEEARYEVARLALSPPAGILAFSSSFRLELLPGEFRQEDGRYLPAQSMPQPELELVRLAGELPNSAIDPQELVSYVETGKLYMPALMERAVRIEPERRGEALDLLAPVIARLNVVDMELLVPALRWLARTDDPGGDPEAWRRFMVLRAEQRSGRDRPRSSGLVLPGS